jgi:hypothetical protein
LKTGAKIENQALNQRAAELAARYGLPGGAGSDAHDPDGIGAAYLDMPDFDGPREFLAKLAGAEITGEHRPHAVRYARPGASAGIAATSGQRIHQLTTDDRPAGG